jgi:hypothetical protein
MDTSELVKSVVNSEHGWAVAEQFEKTYNNEEKFEEANFNALRYIKGVIDDILHSKLLNEDAHNELYEYRDELEEYMVGAKQ